MVPYTGRKHHHRQHQGQGQQNHTEGNAHQIGHFGQKFHFVHPHVLHCVESVERREQIEVEGDECIALLSTHNKKKISVPLSAKALSQQYSLMILTPLKISFINLTRRSLCFKMPCRKKENKNGYKKVGKGLGIVITNIQWLTTFKND